MIDPFEGVFDKLSADCRWVYRLIHYEDSFFPQILYWHVNYSRFGMYQQYRSISANQPAVAAVSAHTDTCCRILQRMTSSIHKLVHLDIFKPNNKELAVYSPHKVPVLWCGHLHFHMLWKTSRKFQGCSAGVKLVLDSLFLDIHCMYWLR